MKTLRKIKSGEDNEIKILKSSAKKSSNYALRESKALGLTVKIISDGNIIEKLPSGKTTVVGTIKKVAVSNKGLKKGMVLCRK